MKHLMSSAVAIGLLIGSPALAADLPSREPAPAPVYAAPVFTWTGFYAGVTAGYAGDKFTYPLTVTGAPIAASASVTSGGLLFGATIGYNYQFANNFVLGLEADWSWANVKGQVGLNAAIGPIGIGATAGSELKSFGTLRARAGYAWNRALFYVTGGFAWGEVDSGLNAALGPIGVALSRSNNLTGWVIGAGVEYALTSNWSFKTEYLYADLGKGSLFAAVVGPATLNLDVDTKVHIVRAGLNYRFGGFLGAPVSPVFSGPTVNWSGFYVGASGGYAGDKFNYPLAVTGLPVAASASVTSSGFLFGGTIGYNYQFANNFVLGLEADWSWANVKGQIGLNAAIGPLGIGATAGSELTSFGTVRARAGYAWNRALIYATGGFAWGNITSGLNAAIGPAGIALSRDNSVSGWTIGGGVEYALTNNWSVKTEYLYTDLGKATLLNTNIGAVNLNLGVETKLHTVRAGLNYRFGGAAAPVFAKY